MYRTSWRLMFSILAAAISIRGAAPHAAATAALERLADGIRVKVDDGFVAVEIKAADIVRVVHSIERLPRVDDLVVVGPPRGGEHPRWTLTRTSTAVVLATDRLKVSISLGDGAVAFANASGNTILAETVGHGTPPRLTPAKVQEDRTHHVQQTWQGDPGESLYGLGQRQEGKLDIKGYDFDLWQRNTVVDIPFLVSSRGYGVLWDNAGFTRFGDTRPFEPIDARSVVNVHDVPAAESLRGWEGEIVAPATGDYQFQTYSNLDIKVWLDGQLQIDHWKQNWATENDQFKVHLQAGRHYPIKVTTTTGATMRLLWKTPSPSATTSFWSETGEAVDYYFVYGPDLDRVVAGYRALTGAASLLPQWAYGFWQSKNKYNTQAEVLDTLAEFRRRQIPIDSIVQDWQYWRPEAWGSHEFDRSRYPDPAAMINAIHANHARFMISVWGKFYPSTENAKALAAIGGLYDTTLKDGTRDWLNYPYAFYDAFNPAARRLFWQQIDRALFSKGVDAWWMDATEPDLVQPSPPTLDAIRRDIGQTALGPASRVMNAYSLLNSRAVYEGQRGVSPNLRVLILTRSGFAGIQRYATVTWSGDITSEWSTLRKQITAGLGFSISGDPYWTTDTGGYTMQNRFARASDGDALDEWRELNARWFEYSSFCPILRVHGTDRPREMWNLGDASTPVYRAQLKFDKLRYALFPYIYSLAGAVTHDGYTLMRPLVMDFRDDAKAVAVGDQYMFGPAFLVSPVTEYKARTRQVYLPAGRSWYDFWTGQAVAGGHTIAADAPYDRIPLHVPAGSIVPVGPDQQYIGEKPMTSATLYVYTGADGRFSIYEDDGLTYGYERRQYSRIPIEWNEPARTLTIGARQGSFDGTLRERVFNVVLVSAGAPVAYAGASVSGRAVIYRGGAVRTKF
ncbi:MAG TPA: TIM-barrel domain-containing protein [Vicinamibacterales bacterium]|nr:TIM-barrel domain-containing protein [Vicinamibacterales bacterium]